MAETTPPPESTQDRIQRWLAQTGAPPNDVSTETSPDPEPKAQPGDATPESDSDDEYTPQPNAQLEGDEEDAPPIRSFADLAKRLDIEEEALAKHLQVPGRDGKDVSLHEVLSSFRAPPPDLEAIQRDRARLGELQAKEAEIGQFAEELRKTAQAFAQRLKGTEPDWAALEKADPSRYTIERLRWMENVRALEMADQQYRAAAERQRAEQQRQFAEFQREQAQKLQSAIPAWRDTRVMQTELDGIAQYLISQSYKGEEINAVTDHRDWLIARKAMLYDELQSKKNDVVAKVRQLPRVLVPGASSGADRGAGARSRQAETEKLERFKESGRVEDAADLIRHRLERSERSAAARALARRS